MTSKKNQTLLSTEIKTTVPDFLLSFIDGIIRLDRCGVLRYQYLNYPIDRLISNYQVPDVSSMPIWIFLNPYGSTDLQAGLQQDQFFTQSKHVVKQSKVDKVRHSEKSSESKGSSPRKDQQSLDKLEPTIEEYQKLSFQPNRKLKELLTAQGLNDQLQKLQMQEFTNIDMIRLKCQANMYFDPQDVIIQIRRIIAWNQLYRAASKKSYQYLSRIFQGMLDLMEKRNYLKKYYDQKAIDLQRISKIQPSLKINIEEDKYPIIPSTFRQYEELDDYQPSPQNRKQIIEKRLKSSKEPVKCPENCVCIMDSNQEQNKGRSFCSYTLMDGWITECPNRLRKVECKHQDPQQMAKCRNAQIAKGERKKCKAYQSQANQQYDLQECIAWGIDLSTRIMIYYSLPQIDIQFMERKQNSENRNNFIERILLKAASFNDKQGYSIRKVCQYIIANSQSLKQIDSSKSDKTRFWKASLVIRKSKIAEEKTYLFTQRSRLYAQNLLKNYELCKDKSAYRIHTKGKGVKCRKKSGIQKGRFIVEYYGQLYEPWRWYEKQDFIKESLKKKKLKNIIPQFYNIYLQKHNDEPNGYDIMVVDPIRKGNFSSRFSHSCDPNCGTIITVSEGRYHIGMYSFRDIEYGQELSFDYCSVTQSNYQHQNSICLCGMKKCRGNYLQLINSKANNVLDKNNCFHFRNATILRSLQALTEEDIKLCESHGIKLPLLKELPQWIAKWMALIIKFMEEQCQSYKKYLIQKWTENYQWETKLTTPQEKQKNIQLYSQSFKSQLFSQRFQNLFTTLDKLKYYTQSIKDQTPPLSFSSPERVASALVTVKDSVFEEIMDTLVQFYSTENAVMRIKNPEKSQKSIPIKQQAIAFIAKQLKYIMKQTEDPNLKLFFFRLSCLLISHLVLRQKPKSSKRKFSYTVFADIVYFYAFTHTFFTPHEYEIFTSQPIHIWISQILGGKREKADTTKKKYSSQFIWGQLVSWFKQTIVSPEASLSQDRRGTLSLPTISSTKFTTYPFQGHNRKNFLKSLKQRPATSWPPSDQCSLSYKNTYKCYGTILFESHFNKEVFRQLPRGSLIDSAIDFINLTLRQKLGLFKKVELLLHKTPQDSPLYEQLLDKAGLKGNLFQSILDQPLPQQILQPVEQEKKKGSKKRKLNQSAKQE